MAELSRYLFLAGAWPFILLGTAHLFATPIHIGDRKGLSPSDPRLAESMLRARFRLTSRTDMWRAWVGFNFSHGLGALLFGVSVLLVGRDQASFMAGAHLFLPFAVVGSAVYLVLGSLYWFRIPIIGCAIAAGCFASSWAAFVLGTRT
jgi:hypothetical protein